MGGLTLLGRVTLAAGALALAALGGARADETAPSGDFALVGCTVETCAGPAISDGVVVVRKGKIAAAGPRADVKIPKGVQRIDAAGKVVTPGFVHVISRLGVRGDGGGNANAVSPAKTSADELNPWLDENRWAAEAGFTSLGLSPGQGIVAGRGVVVRSGADDVAAMMRREDAFLRVDVSQGSRFTSALAGQLSIARKDLVGLAKWEIEHATWATAKAEAEKAKKPVPKEPQKPDLPDARKPYHQVLRGESALLCFVGSSADVVTLAEALGDEAVRGEDLRLYCVIGGDAFRSAPELLDMGAVCVVRAGHTSWPNTEDRICPAVYLRNAGLEVVLLPFDETRDGLAGYTISLGRMVGSGFPRSELLAATTAGPAKLLGVADQVGSIEEGRRADLVLWSGDPLLATTRLLSVWIDGEPVEDLP